MIRHAVLAAILALSALGCEHPAEPDESAELRAGVDNPLGEDEDREREGDATERARTSPPPRHAERAASTPAGPRTSTPGGAASGLHQEPLSGAAGTCPAQTTAAPTCREVAPA